MVSILERARFETTSAEFLRMLHNIAARDCFPLKAESARLPPRILAIGRGYGSLLEMESAIFDLELWTCQDQNYGGLEPRLWFGLYSSNQKFLSHIKDRTEYAFKPKDWTRGNLPDCRHPIFERASGEFYLGLYEDRREGRAEAPEEYRIRCSNFIESVCSELGQSIRAYTSNSEAEVERQSRFRKIALRREQQKFSFAIRFKYDEKCAVTGCTVGAANEAAHIRVDEHHQTDFNDDDNGILLRADIHALLDACLITFSLDGKRI